MNQDDCFDPASTLAGPRYRIDAGRHGALRVETGGDWYLLESFFSFPDERIGTNGLTLNRCGETEWSPRVQRVSPHQLRFEAVGRRYRLVRTVTIQGPRVLVADILSNDGSEEVGILIGHRVCPGAPLIEARIGGGPDPATDPHAQVRPVARPTDAGVTWPGIPVRHLSAENPTLYAALPRSGLGIVAEDSISRLQFNGTLDDGCPQYTLGRFGLAANTTRALRWAIYPLAASSGYFGFINQVRRDWGTNFEVSGPWGFFDVVHHENLLSDPARLRAYLGRKQLRTAALMPWLDYDNYHARHGRLVDRREYRKMMQSAATALRHAAPGIRCTGCMEGNIVGLPEAAVRELYALIPEERRRRGYPIPFTDEQEDLLRRLPLPWKDCLYTGPDGRHAYELYYRGPLWDPAGDRNEQDPRRVPMMAMMVYAAPGNDQLAYWLDQARFLIEEVGLDGIYIDQFSLAFTELQRYSYEGWDGLTVDLDPATGHILRRCIDGAWVGAGARRSLIEYVLDQGKEMVANSAAAVEEVQTLPIPRFMEAEFPAGEMGQVIGQQPALRFTPCKGHLGSPVALGSRPEHFGEAATREYARYITRTAVDFLRHGVLYYHYLTEIPETGPGSGEYGAINQMFPFTPVALHEGWVEGRERIITTVSGTYPWPWPEPPRVTVFDPEGRAVARRIAPIRDSGGWRVELSLRDWAEIAVLEATDADS
jgi:hypothetical protein